MSPIPLPSRAPLQQYSGAETPFDGFPDPARFSPEFGEAHFRAAARQTNDDPAPRLLSLHLRLPFDTAAPADPGRSRAYAHRLARECAIVAPLFDRDRDVVQLQLDGLGGELPDDLPGELLHAVSRYFFLSRSDTREFLIALPDGAQDSRSLAGLVDLGFNRLRLSTPPIAADGEPAARFARRVGDAREAGFRSIAVELRYACPSIGDTDFDAGLHRLLACRPDRIALRDEDASLHDRPPGERGLRHAIATRALLAADYEALGLDHFVLPQDDLARARRDGPLHYNGLGFAAQAPTDLIGLGVGARSRIGDTCFQSYAELAAWESSIDMGDLPVWRGLRLDPDQRLRSDVVQALLCTGRVDLDALRAQHGIVFAEYFRDELAALQPLRDADLLRLDAQQLQLGPQGRLALQAICAPFGATGRRS